MGERELRREERERGAPLASAQLGSGPDGGPLLHRPDLVLWPNTSADPLPVAVEVELTVKAPRRLLEICRAWARCRAVAGVLYLGGATRSSARSSARSSRRTRRADRARRLEALVGRDRGRVDADRENRPRRCVALPAGGQPARKWRPACPTSASTASFWSGVSRATPSCGRCPRERASAACESPATRAGATPTASYTERPNFFDVSVYGASGESVEHYMRKGSRVAIDGRLEWREWETADQQQAPGGERRRRHASSSSTARASAPGWARQRGSRATAMDGRGGRELVGVGAGSEEEDLAF